MKRFSVVVTLLLSACAASGADKAAVGKAPEDSRLSKVRTLNDKDFFLKVPASKEAWEKRRQELREQLLVATGLWPMPEKTPLHPVIHGKIERDGYTIEMVYFASRPGHYVSGNLYRPKGKTGKLPGVLCPHGHWANGRMYDAGEKAAAKQVEQKAEQTLESARFPLQARCAALARLGCIVFHYDMVGNADSKMLTHRAGFTDADAELRLQSFMGLQSWNSIRSLDFLLSLPNVDPRRIGVTGASGGGTQTFILCALDERPTVAFPAVMVSTAMQGGCVCENCSYLRQGTGNVELAALFAPKPLGMSGANDWTIDIETKGLPELKALYKLYGAGDNVMAKCFPQFAHNYNQVSREVMYNWFNKHLQLGMKEPIAEKPFVPVPPKELSVFNEQYTQPKDAVGADRLRQLMTEAEDKQISALKPQDAKSLEEFRRIVGTALRVMIHDHFPAADEVSVSSSGANKEGIERLFLGRKGQGEAIPALLVKGKNFNGNLVVWIDPQGKSSLMKDGALVPAAQRIVAGGAGILAVDVFMTGEFAGATSPGVNQQYAGYTFGYNRPLLANRVHDILTALGCAKHFAGTKSVHLVGFEQAGPWVLLARSLSHKAVARTAADIHGFRFERVRSTNDEMMLPGALRYGGLPALASLCAPGELFIHNQRGTGMGSWMQASYQAAGAEANLKRQGEKASPEEVVTWLLR